MAELATAYVSLLPSLKGLKKQTTEGMKGVGDKAGKQYGEEFADGVTRGADGKLRDANGRYVKQSKETGEESGRQYSKGMTGTLLAGVVAGAALAGAALAKGVGDAIEREKLGDKTAAALGLSEKQSANAGAVAGRLYAGAYGESTADVTSAVESVLSSVEGMSTATPKQLEGVTASILDMATAFDLDVSEAAQNVGILMKQGLAKDATEATDLITAALQKVPVALRGDVGDATQEYSQFFADLGFTGSQAMGLLVSATEDGAYGIDKIGDSIKEFTIRSTDMSKTTTEAYETLGLNSKNTTNDLLAGGDRAKQAFDTIIGGIKGIKDPAEQSQVALALFGTPLEDLGTNEIPAFLDGLTSTKTSLGDVDGAAADLGTTLNDNLATKLETIKRTAEVFVSDGLGAIYEGFKTGETSGSGFMGMLSEVGVTARDATAWFKENESTIKLVSSAVLGATAAWGIYMLITQGIPAALAAVRAAQIAVNVAMAANPIGLVVVAIGALVGALIYLYQNNETVRRVIDAAWAGIKTAIAAVVDWFTGTAWPFLQGVLRALGDAMSWLYQNVILPVWDGIKAAISVAWTVIRVIFVTFATAFALLWEGIKWVWSKTGAPLFIAIRQAATAVWNWLRDKVFAPLKVQWDLLLIGMAIIKRNVLDPMWAGIKTGASAVWNFLKSYVFAPLKAAWTALGTAFEWVKEHVIDPVWSGIKTAASAAWNWIRDKAFGPLEKGLDAVGKAFDATKKFISTAWDKIKEAAAKPINFVITEVYTKGIKKTWDKIADSVGLDLVLPDIDPIGGFASGGVLPGYTPGRDVHSFFSPTGGRLDLSGGEAIMRPEFTRAVGGPAGVAHLNSAARAGQAFAGGGVWDWAGDAWNSAKGVASQVGKLLSNPAGALGDMLSKPLESILGGIGGGTVGKIAAQLPRKAVGALIEKAKSLLSTVLPGGGKAGPAMGWQAQWNVIKGMFPGANLHSAYRPGAITAVGTPSFHGKGRAVDVTPSMAIFNWLAKAFPNSSELIFSPAGGRQLYMGKQTMFGEPTRGDHWDHIHWAMANGGVLPKLYDQGGWLPSGGLGMNQTGKPEAVLTPAESSALKDGLHRRPARNITINATKVTTRDVLFALDVADLHDVGSPA